MEDKQRITALCRAICGNKDCIKDCSEHCPTAWNRATRADNAGYCKQSDTAREFAEKAKEVIHNEWTISSAVDERVCESIDEIAAEFGAEVEE